MKTKRKTDKQPPSGRRVGVKRMVLTAHALARQLLKGPDLPVYMHKVEKYAGEDDDQSPMMRPVVSRETAINAATDKPIKCLVIDHEIDRQNGGTEAQPPKTPKR